MDIPHVGLLCWGDVYSLFTRSWRGRFSGRPAEDVVSDWG